MRGSIVRRGKSYSVVVDLGRDPETGNRRQKWHSGYRTAGDYGRQARDRHYLGESIKQGMAGER